jgi:hypothetical protein
MRHSGVLLGALLLFAFGAGAQINAQAPLLVDQPSTIVPASLAFASEPGAGALPAKPEPASLLPEPAMPQEIQGIYGDYYTQVFIGATFLRFWELPSTQQSLGGADVSMAYYLKPWVAADLEAFDAAGSDSGSTANFFFFGGGPRLRWQVSNSLEIWAHCLGGVAHYSPTTIYGFPTGGAFEAGGGVDFGHPHRRWGYRVQGDLVGTFLFGVHQFSPRVSAGIVLKF